MKFKRLMAITLLILMAFSNTSYADYTIDTSNNIIVDGWIRGTHNTVVKYEENFIYEEDIIKALDELRFDFNGDYTIHVVDYSLYGGNALGMALPENTIILFDFIPGRLDKVIQNTVVHELGHLVYMNMSEDEQSQYKVIRGIPDDCDNYPRTNYINRPQEIFAEDFRILYGGEDARMSGHFNQELTHPKKVKGLRRFIRQFEVKETTF